MNVFINFNEIVIFTISQFLRIESFNYEQVLVFLQYFVRNCQLLQIEKMFIIFENFYKLVIFEIVAD